MLRFDETPGYSRETRQLIKRYEEEDVDVGEEDSDFNSDMGEEDADDCTDSGTGESAASEEHPPTTDVSSGGSSAESGM